MHPGHTKTIKARKTRRALSLQKQRKRLLRDDGKEVLKKVVWYRSEWVRKGSG